MKNYKYSLKNKLGIYSKALAFIIALLFGYSFQTAYSEEKISKKHILVASKILNFTIPKMTGQVFVAVVFDKNNVKSE